MLADTLTRSRIHGDPIGECQGQGPGHYFQLSRSMTANLSASTGIVNNDQSPPVKMMSPVMMNQ